MVVSVNSSQSYLITSYEELRREKIALKDHFQRDTLVKKSKLKKQYFRMEWIPMEVHINIMKELIDRLAAINATTTHPGLLGSQYNLLVTPLL